jgi:hypothetical protein
MAELVLDLGVTVMLVILGVEANRDLPVQQENNERVLFKFNSATECPVRKRNWWFTNTCEQQVRRTGIYSEK